MLNKNNEKRAEALGIVWRHFLVFKNHVKFHATILRKMNVFRNMGEKKAFFFFNTMPGTFLEYVIGHHQRCYKEQKSEEFLIFHLST